jgi:hypothetical protein
MNRIFSIQFNFGVAGIFSSIIWILTKFGLIKLTMNEWISISLLIFSFAMFYYYLSVRNDGLIVFSIFSFFTSIVFIIYWLESAKSNNRINFNFEFFYYAFAFSIISFFLIKSFYSNAKYNLLTSSILLLFTLIGIFGFQFLNDNIKSSQIHSFIYYYNEVKRYLVNLCLVALIYFPVKNLMSVLKQNINNDDRLFTR